MNIAKRLDADLLRRLSVQASVDPRSLQKLLAGKPVRGMAGRRALEALQAAGLMLPDEGDLPPDGTPVTARMAVTGRGQRGARK